MRSDGHYERCQRIEHTTEGNKDGYITNVSLCRVAAAKQLHKASDDERNAGDTD